MGFKLWICKKLYKVALKIVEVVVKDHNEKYTKLDEYLEKNTSKIEDGINRYIKLIQDDIEYDKKTGGREIFRYSTQYY